MCEIKINVIYNVIRKYTIMHENRKCKGNMRNI